MKASFPFIVFGLIIIIIANIIGHYFPPFSLTNTFIYMNIIVGLVNIPLYKRNFNATVAYNYFLHITNDLFIRLYAGGNHDGQGMGWCWLMFHIGFIISIFIMIIYTTIFTQSKKESLNPFFTIIILAILTGVFYNFINAEI